MKTTKRFLGLLIILTLILNVSCNFAQDKNNNIEINEFIFKKDTAIANVDENGEQMGILDTCHGYIDLSLLMFKSNDKIDENKLNQFVTSNLKELNGVEFSDFNGLKSYLKDYVPINEEDYKISINLNNDKVISLTMYSRRLGCGGNIVSMISTYLNYDILNNKEIELKDILLSNELKNVENKCKQILIKDFNKSDLDSYDYRLSDIFYITNDNIVFYYPTYTIGCGAEGPFEVPIPFSDISSSLTETFKKMIDIK